ncbi:MAG: hypothetical protein AAB914_00250 [Patescibacteria group bacterium]
MLLIIHIIIALSSILTGAIILLKPTQTRISINYGLIGATLTTGTYLIISTSGHLVQACISGLIYTSVVTFFTLQARKKLASQTN